MLATLKAGDFVSESCRYQENGVFNCKKTGNQKQNKKKKAKNMLLIKKVKCTVFFFFVVTKDETREPSSWFEKTTLVNY